MQLNQNEFVANLMNVIVKFRLNDTASGRRINDLLDATIVDETKFGDSMAVISVDTLTVKDYSDTSSLLAVNKPTMDEQILTTTDRKLIEVTINRYLMAGAFADEYALSEAIARIESMLEKTKNIYNYKKTVLAYQGWTPVDTDGDPVNEDTQIITIDLKSTAGLDGTALKDTNTANALKIYETIREHALNMQAPSRKYNELQYEEMYNAEDMIFIANAKYDTLINTHAYASLLNSDKLNNIMLYDKSIVVPNDQFTDTPTKDNTIGWLASKFKYMISPRFILVTSFLDGSTLNLNEFLHMWLISGFARGLGMIKFVANYE